MNGHEAVFVIRREELGRAAATRISADGGVARDAAFDICDAPDVAEFFAAEPRVDVLVNCTEWPSETTAEAIANECDAPSID